MLDKAGIEHEVIVVNDGSTDRTGAIAEGLASDRVRVLHHPVSGGYGHSLKDGIRHARYEWIGITDADGTYPVERLPELYAAVTAGGYDMAVGARTGVEYRGTRFKMNMRRIFQWLCEYATGRTIADVNSGLRVFRRSIALRFIHTLCDGFSFTTTITLAALLNGYFVQYLPIEYHKRSGQSKVVLWRDSLRTLQIIVENILYYNPLKLFLLLVFLGVALSAAFLAGALVTTQPVLREFLVLSAALCFASGLVTGAIGLSARLAQVVELRYEIKDLHAARTPAPAERPERRDDRPTAGPEGRA